MSEKKRWRYLIRYRTDNPDREDILTGTVEEIEELHEIVEMGPPWSSMIEMTVHYNLGDDT